MKPWSDYRLLLKGIEEETFTTKADGQIVGLSRKISQALDGFHCEHDQRNAEYATAPQRNYTLLGEEIVEKRRNLRQFLNEIGDFVPVPGAVMANGGYQEFQRSKPDDIYHSHIEAKYGTCVVTAGTHINIGLAHPELRFEFPTSSAPKRHFFWP